jgi:hypothetical protein
MYGRKLGLVYRTLASTRGAWGIRASEGTYCPSSGRRGGEGDLRSATKAELLTVGLELKVLREENNEWNQRCWGVKVDEDGNLI